MLIPIFNKDEKCEPTCFFLKNIFKKNRQKNKLYIPISYMINIFLKLKWK